ncbi:MAG: carbohydrate ABC transporter permease [Armatimonadota bacterium]
MDSNKPAKRIMSNKKREALAAYGFLLPNFVGFLAFTSIPVIVSFIMAFTHWNIFKPPTWVGFDNFISLLWYHQEGGKNVPNDPFFWQYVYNTVYLLVGIPIGMAGSLITAILMNQKLKGIVIFRTLYFLPAVCSGVAVLILWKYLYNADIGLVNKSLRILGEHIYDNKIIGIGFTVICAALFGVAIIAVVASIVALIQWLFEKIKLPWADGIFRVIMVTLGAAIFIMVGVYGRSIYLTLSGFMLTPPDWLGTVQWAKPSFIIMGLWGGLGGYNMILYLAALQGVPRSMYEAAEIDGASPWAKFWAVTWPMISPTTFFILVMSIIGGFQGGFMTASVLTAGGPAGSTTTVEYYLFQTAFEKFNMGYASAIAWFIFAVVLILTLLTWKLGGKVVTYE